MGILGAPITPATVVGALITCFLVPPTATVIYNLYFHPLSKFPGPAWRAAFYFPDCWSMFIGNAHIDTQKLHNEYGQVVRISPNALSFNTAQAWKDIYGSRVGKEQLEKDPIIFQRGPATNIVVANNVDHARIRKLLSHAFSESALREQESILTGYFDLLVSRLKEQSQNPNIDEVDIMSWYNFTTFDIIGIHKVEEHTHKGRSDLALGDSFRALENGQYHAWIRNIFASVKFLGIMRCAATYPIINQVFKRLMSMIPSMAEKRKAHFAFTKQKTESRLDRDTDRKDFTTYIQRYNDERGMTREEIISNSGILLVAGSETTATLLSGATYHILSNPVVLKKLQAEIRDAFQSEDEITAISVRSPGKLPYMEAVLTESLRMYPPIPASLPRMIGSMGDIIDGHFVPANVIASIADRKTKIPLTWWQTSVGVHQSATYQSSANFTDPKSFVPERWLPEAPERYRNDRKDALQPFSVGPRNCLGKNLAYFEMRSILTRMMWHFDMELCEQSRAWAQQKAYLLWDKPPLWVKLSNRS